MLFFENKEILINGIKYPMDDEGNQYFLFRIGRILGLIKLQGLFFYLADEDILAVMKQCVLVIIILFQRSIQGFKIGFCFEQKSFLIFKC